MLVTLPGGAKKENLLANTHPSLLHSSLQQNRCPRTPPEDIFLSAVMEWSVSESGFGLQVMEHVVVRHSNGESVVYEGSHVTPVNQSDLNFTGEGACVFFPGEIAHVNPLSHLRGLFLDGLPS